MSTTSLPQHIALIMDGNRRWARQKGFQLLKGHEYVANTVIENLVDRCVERGIPYLTLWAFSTENWQRDQQEVQGILTLFRQAFSKSSRELHEKGVRLRVIGDVSRFPKDIRENIEFWLNETSRNTNITVTFALNYGGRDELYRMVKKVAQQVSDGLLAVEHITPELITDNLDTAGLPDPDLIIRPGGEKRLSGYLPWQGVYAELYFTDVLMPDFDGDQLDVALAEYAHRSRRFGK
jgi:undecaprenyl diphosphate synthase